MQGVEGGGGVVDPGTRPTHAPHRNLGHQTQRQRHAHPAAPPRRPFKATTSLARSPHRAQLSSAAAALRRLRATLRALSRQAATEAALRRLTHLVNVSIAHF